MSIDHFTLYSKAQTVASNNGMPIPLELPPLGEWVRVPGAGKSQSNKAGAVMRDHDRVCLVDHSRGWACAVFPDGSTSGQDRASALEAYREAERKRKATQAKERAASMRGLERYLSRAATCSRTPYSTRKGIKFAHGASYVYRDQCLIIELQNIDGALQSAQRIFDNGDKRFWPNLPIAGAYHQIGHVLVSQRLLICEGWATGCTLHEQTGLTVACAMVASNLKPVAQSFRKRYPALEIVICGDDDRTTPGNPGRTKATEAAKAISAALAFPEFPDGVAGSDFNDMHQTTNQVSL